MLSPWLVVVLLVAPWAASAFGSMKHVTVVGRVSCDTKVAKDVKVELWEADRWNIDDLLNTTFPQPNGTFIVYGQESEVSIEPYVKFLHHCDEGRHNGNCEIIDRYNVPSDAVMGTYDMGIVSLNVVTDERKRHCE